MKNLEKIKEILAKVKDQNKLRIKENINYYEKKQADYNQTMGDDKYYAIEIMDAKIRLALIDDIFNEIDMELEGDIKI